MKVSSSDLQINTRALSRLISNAGFKRLANQDDYKVYGRQIKNLLAKGGVDVQGKCTVKELLDFSYSYLLQEYRHEYIYKTSLLSNFILKNFSLKESVILNEFKIGKSKADVVLVNGSNKVFEIKTELDSPERLKTQILDYYKAFSEVYIVTHHSLKEKYLKILDPQVGLMVFEHDNTLAIARKSTPCSEYLDSSVMLKSLRKKEYLYVIQSLEGTLPHTTAVNLFKECLLIAAKHTTIEVQKHFLKAIKSRIHQDDLLVTADNVPEYLKFICYCLNFKEIHYLSLLARLSQPI